MGNKRVLSPAKDLDWSAVKYEPEAVHAPHFTGFMLKFFVMLAEMPLVSSLIFSLIKKQNRVTQLLRNTSIPEPPMFRPEFPPQDPEPRVVVVAEDSRPEDRVSVALDCLPPYAAPSSWTHDADAPFRYWKIRDYSYAYRSKLASPTIVAEHFISNIEELRKTKPEMPYLISFDAEDVRKQAAASTQRFEEGNPISVLDGIFMAIKDDIDCFPHPSKGASTFYHEVREVHKDAVSVSRLRQCGAILVGKANMHEFGLGTTGNNPHYGTTRNPHAEDRYTGGSSSGPAAIVASGLCSAALGTDGGGSVRIPSSLCGVVGFKTTYGRTDIAGALCDSGTVEIIGPIASTVEDVMLVYAAILGASPSDRYSLKPGPPCFPNGAPQENSSILGSLRLGKYTEWFNDVFSSEISEKCEDALNLITKFHGCEVKEIVVPELHPMQVAHMVSIGSESLASLTPDCEDGKLTRLAYDTRTNLALFRSFSASDYVAAQCIRRRIMHYHMEIFKKVDVIVTPTTGMTAPKIPPSALKDGETNLQVTGSLMRFIMAPNLLGLPAITIPIGYDKEGLPIGLQLIGRPWAEATLLRLASAVEELCTKSKKRPAAFYDILKVE
uniref:Amidase domain-containing protein n=2 Tax=Kalanchoe fedtschenkoi TaxID=63787 RepID=A0A7N0ZWT6_KALFE